MGSPLRGTEGLNPAPSSGESDANLTFGAHPLIPQGILRADPRQPYSQGEYMKLELKRSVVLPMTAEAAY
jgi:hypothetical protein